MEDELFNSHVLSNVSKIVAFSILVTAAILMYVFSNQILHIFEEIEEFVSSYCPHLKMKNYPVLTPFLLTAFVALGSVLFFPITLMCMTVTGCNYIVYKHVLGNLNENYYTSIFCNFTLCNDNRSINRKHFRYVNS